MEMPAASNLLVRYIGRVLSGRQVPEWKAMTTEERAPFLRQARTVLRAERKWLERYSDEVETPNA